MYCNKKKKKDKKDKRKGKDKKSYKEKGYIREIKGEVPFTISLHVCASGTSCWNRSLIFYQNTLLEVSQVWLKPFFPQPITCRIRHLPSWSFSLIMYKGEIPFMISLYVCPSGTWCWNRSLIFYKDVVLPGLTLAVKSYFAYMDTCGVIRTWSCAVHYYSNTTIL